MVKRAFLLLGSDHSLFNERVEEPDITSRMHELTEEYSSYFSSVGRELAPLWDARTRGYGRRRFGRCRGVAGRNRFVAPVQAPSDHRVHRRRARFRVDDGPI